MPFTIRVIRNKKEILCEKILRQLPEWFGIEDSIKEYSEDSKHCDMYAAFIKDTPVGFISIKNNNIFTSEILVLGVLKKYHSQKIGQSLIEYAEKSLKLQNKEFLFVKTLGPSAKCKYYEKTRKFYVKYGFRPLDELHGYWDENNPTLLMAKKL